MTAETNGMRELSCRICKDYLSGAWKNITPQNVGFERISGGLSNLLYCVSLPETCVPDKTNEREPRQVLIRIYGQVHGERALESIITDSVIFTLLSERGLGPKLYGVFPGGRIEQYINARPLLTRELADEGLSSLIAQKMATIHSMEVPLHKAPTWLWDTIERWLKSSEKILRGHVPDHAKELTHVDLRSEMKWLRNRLEEEQSPVVFCHNDMQEGNILIPLTPLDGTETNGNDDTKLILIDFEYCSYNYRAFDLANHFLEWTYDYTSSEYPYYEENTEAYPTSKQRLHFIDTYLKEVDCGDEPGKLLEEVRVFSLASHFFWALWAIVYADTSKIPFGYWEYSISRFRRYFSLKEELSKTPTKTD